MTFELSSYIPLTIPSCLQYNNEKQNISMFMFQIILSGTIRYFTVILYCLNMESKNPGSFIGKRYI